MIALDSSSLIAYFSGEEGDDVEQVEEAFVQKLAVLPPVVLSEMLSDSELPAKVVKLIKEIPRLSVTDEYWVRVGFLRAKILSKGLKARLADTLIAQSCLDHQVPLVTRDSDFRHFVGHGLKIL